MATISFVEQLPKRSVVRQHTVNAELEAIAAALKERPGSWAQIAEKTASFGAFYGLKSLGCELTLRNMGVEEYEKNGEKKERRLYNVFARFVPEEPKAASTKAGKK